MNLSKKHCVPCEGGAVPLSNSIEDELLHQIPDWEIDRLFEHRIRKVFTFKSFTGAIDFVNKVAAIAEREGHHPELRINFKKVIVELYTHVTGGLSENDFIVAKKIDGIVAALHVTGFTGTPGRKKTSGPVWLIQNPDFSMGDRQR